MEKISLSNSKIFAHYGDGVLKLFEYLQNHFKDKGPELLLGGYFSNESDFKSCVKGDLSQIVCTDANFKNAAPFICRDQTTKEETAYKFFAPFPHVKFETVTKFRPYKNTHEFPKKLGESIIFRPKTEARNVIKKEHYSLITSFYSEEKDTNLISVAIGYRAFAVDILLKSYEWWDGKKWCIFGMEEQNEI